MTREKEKAGSIPDFGKSFGANPAATDAKPANAAAADAKPGEEAKPADAQAAAATKEALTGTFRKGMEGDEVKQLQESLKAAGANIEADGKFGNKTRDAVKAYQEKNGLTADGIAGKDTLGRLQGGAAPAKPGDAKPGETKPGEEAKPGETTPGAGLDLPAGYESLEKLSGELSKRDPRFNTDTASGRAATAMALAIGGTEVYGKGQTGTDFFTKKGGTGNNMKGFAQFNQAYHSNKTSTPEKYTKFMGDILNGNARMPNSKSGGDHVAALTQAVESGKIKTGQDLRNFMDQRGFGGSNWQGIDDGWGRNPGLANALAGFLNNGS